MVDKLEGKLYQLAMGIVDTDITKTITKEVTEEVEDPDTGEKDEVVHTRTTRTNIKENGRGTPDIQAVELMLRNYAPESYNTKPIEAGNEIEPVKVVDDIFNTEVDISDQPKLFYDDSQAVWHSFTLASLPTHSLHGVWLSLSVSSATMVRSIPSVVIVDG